MKQQKFDGKILIVGFGSIGQGVLPLLLRHLTVPPEKITIVTADKRGRSVAKEFGVRFMLEPLTPDNYEKVILSHIGRGDFLCNVSVDVSSTDLIKLCQEKGILYIDTVVEPWAGYYTDASLSMSERSNYALREKALALRPPARDARAGNLPITGPRPTAVVAHGANPGLVSHFVKEALLRIAKDTGEKVMEPKTREEWAALAQKLEIKVIHIAERDTQAPKKPKQMDEFVNTWSVDGFYSEGCQPSEMGWGTHEKHMPEKGRKHDFGCKAAIYLEQPGLATQVRSWTPISGPQYGWVITHNESISIADYLTVKDEGRVVYRPTVHYAYHPCDGAVLSLIETAERGGTMQNISRLISNEILPGGVDELGVLLMGHKKNALWYGSRLSIDEARALVPHNNATGLQVCAGILGAMIWAIRNPEAGIVDAEELDHHVVMEAALPYLGTMLAEYTDWTPLAQRGELFPEKLDKKDPWQFNNFLVS
ncbi:MAG: saccharopine dehydrogenase NADP-binding domain-containing protein [bacterium]|nr:saccharopine dehydrogenase NADP-binding domain-containing protein [bacterium]